LETVDNYTFGKVQINDQVYFTKTELNAEFIYTISVENKQYFESIKTLKNRNNIQKNNLLPNYFEKKNSVTKPVSISNHGRFERIISL
jgi:hypothetical protein